MSCCLSKEEPLKKRVHDGLKDFIEYAMRTKKYHDAGFYKAVQEYIGQLEGKNEKGDQAEKV